jgi:hypothetical protein
MRPRFSESLSAYCVQRVAGILLIAGALLIFTYPPAWAGNGAGKPIYTWVDAQGARHYSDHPASPKAHLISLSVPTLPPALSAPVKPAPIHRAPRASPPPAITVSPAARAAQCRQLQGEVARLQSARRVKVNQKGKPPRYLSGEELVKFRHKLARSMQSACAPSFTPAPRATTL